MGILLCDRFVLSSFKDKHKNENAWKYARVLEAFHYEVSEVELGDGLTHPVVVVKDLDSYIRMNSLFIQMGYGLQLMEPVKENTAGYLLVRDCTEE